jgi:glycosyltransferase involved in cell wall biosynthesis
MATNVLSVVIPTRNEEKELPRCLRALRASWDAYRASRPHSSVRDLEIVVVINRCTDRTEEIARSAGCVIVYNDKKNLASIRNTGVRTSVGDLVITVDADSRVSMNMITTVVDTMSGGGIIGGGVLIIPERWSLGIFVTGLLLLPIALWYGISAGLFFFRREAFEGIGGFNELLPSVEDIHFARDLKCWAKARDQRYKNVLKAHIVTSCRKFDRFGDWYFVRNIGLTTRLLRGSDSEGADRVWYDFPRE